MFSMALETQGIVSRPIPSRRGARDGRSFRTEARLYYHKDMGALFTFGNPQE